MSLLKLNRPNIFPSLNPFWDNFLEDESELSQAVKQGKSIPAVNISEEDDEYRLELAAPGLMKKDFNVDVKNGVLSISSEQSDSNEVSEKNYTRKEYSYNSFCRSFSLPENTTFDDIMARYEDGVLKITIPKKEVEKESKSSIEVK